MSPSTFGKTKILTAAAPRAEEDRRHPRLRGRGHPGDRGGHRADPAREGGAAPRPADARHRALAVQADGDRGDPRVVGSAPPP